MKTFQSSIHPSRAGPHNWRTRFVFPGALIGFALVAGSAFAAPPGTVPFGVYDPHGSFDQDTDVSIEHIFLPWDGVDLSSLHAADAYARQRNRALLVTVEPWIWGAAETSDGLRSNILSGRHDATMRSVCSTLGRLQSPVTVRWAQEMDNPNGHFPWAMWRPADYVEAYTRMVGVCRSVAPDAQFMWSPVGHAGMAAYYPGDDVVDVIGLSVFGAQDYEIARYGNFQGFAQVLGPRYERAVTFAKPIIVAELGYVGNAAYLADWHNAVRQPHGRFSELMAVIYFNREEVFPWPDNFGLPDWRQGASLSN